ncbi:nitronate monooxygenase [Psychromicrobium sp. YIM B11713]|uniref:nitronate monooxygenase n=1 Tax=Psychromicrobium sp. YIM B11713 TaxID=3145233 RepID=UPI00374E534D
MFSSPLIVAPMAGGPSSPELVIAAAQQDTLAFLAAGYQTAVELAQQITAVHIESSDFGVNIFVPDDRAADQAALLAYRQELSSEAIRYGIELPEVPPTADNDDWEAKIELLIERPVAYLSFTFGLPSAGIVKELHRQGSTLLATVTTAEEASAATARGVDALIVQHPHAGGHSAAFLHLDERPWTGSLHELLGSIRQASSLPLIAAGGLGDRAGIAQALQKGATAVQLGTAFLRAHEAGTREVHRTALSDPGFTRTARTRAFSGRWARGLENRFLREHQDAPQGYPQIHHLTSPLRAAAARAADPHGVNLWAGTAFRKARSAPLADLLAELAG